jgi:hypothetical protein
MPPPGRVELAIVEDLRLPREVKFQGEGRQSVVELG